MWYIYLLIGLYLYMPFFSAWIENADRKTKRAFLLIWIISLFIPYLKEYVANCLFERSGYVFGTDTWNEFGLFYYFAGFNGYLLLGHYVKKGNDWSLMKTFILCILACLPSDIISLIQGSAPQRQIPMRRKRRWNSSLPSAAPMCY